MKEAPIAVITGATSGIGFETCRLLARAGWRLRCIGRDARKAAAAADVFRSSGSPQVEVFLCDLASLAATRQLGGELAARGEPLDLLLNNAGALFHRREVTAEGFERTFALNHLGYFALTSELLPLLQLKRSSGEVPAAVSARIVNVASAAHYGGALDFDDLQMTHNYSGWRQYQNSKLMNVLFTRELARQLAGSGISANCLHPGFVASRFGSNNVWWWKALFGFAKLFAISPQKSARAVAHVAISASLAQTSGAYFNLDQRATPSLAAQDDSAAQRLWRITDDLVKSMSDSK